MPHSPPHRTNRLFSTRALDRLVGERSPRLTPATDPRTAERVRTLWERSGYEDGDGSHRESTASFVPGVLRTLGHTVRSTDADSDLVGRSSAAELWHVGAEGEDGGEGTDDPVAVVQVEPWDQPLDTTTGDSGPPPCHSLHATLQAAPVRWGLLTDGRRWRLYHESTSHRLDEYYEADLEAVLDADDPDAFAEFCALVGRPAFDPGFGERPLLDRLLADSRVDAAAERDALETNVREAITTLATALAASPAAPLDRDAAGGRGAVDAAAQPTDRSKPDRSFEASTTLVFRTLVALFAESEGRSTLDADVDLDPGAISSSVDDLHELARTWADSSDSDACEPSVGASEGVPRWRVLLAVLDSLSAEAARARDAPASAADGGRGLDGDGRGARRSKGGRRSDRGFGSVFPTGTVASRSSTDRLLRASTVADDVVARVLDLLTRYRHDGSPRDFEYRTMEMSVLGDLYEGLLGLELADTAADSEVAAGSGTEFSLRANADDRKATGSFYTPRRVVEHVVDEALDPLVAEIREETTPADGADASHEDRGPRRELVERRRDRLRSLDVVDPAVGTGHFLLAAIDALALELVAAGEGGGTDRDGVAEDGSTAIEVARETVVRNCLYGVDRDPVAVDLARAACWIRTSPSGPAPAALSDRLVVGDALVGVADPASVAVRRGDSGDGPPEVDGGPSRGRPSFRSVPAERLRALANVRTAAEAGLDLPADGIGRVDAALRDDDAWDAVSDEPWFEAAQERATAERYLHWPLAFPSVFGVDDPVDAPGGDSAGFDGDSAGFDAVIANPPWVATAGRDGISASIDADRRSTLESTYVTATGQFDLYGIFLERAVRLSRGRRVGVVVPDSILTRESNEPIRSYLLANCPPAHVVRLGRAFENVETGVAALVCGGSPDAVACADATRHGRDDSPPFVGGSVDTVDPADLPTASIPLSVFERAAERRFLIHLDEATRSVIDRVERSRALGTFATISRGEEVSKRADALTTDPGNGLRPILPGSAVRRYGVDAESVRYVDPTDLRKDERTYRAPKCCFRQTGDALVGTYDSEGVATIKSVYSIHVDSDASGQWERPATLKHVLGVLSSPLLAFYHHYKHAAYRSVFPQLNQSTFAAFPVAIPDGPDDRLVSLVEDRLAATAERAELDPDPEQFLEFDADGVTLGDLAACRPATGVGETRLVDTTDEWAGLRIGSVDASVSGDGVSVAATVRYKPGDGRTGTDRWGYLETDPIPALTVDDVGEDRAALLETVCSRAVGHGGGGVRPQATKTISPLDRLLAVAIPPLAAVREDLRAYRRERERARELDERIDRLDGRIAERVFDLYGVDDRERKLVRGEFG